MGVTWTEVGADCRVACGDALAVLPELDGDAFDLLLTDPPYGTRAESDGYGRRHVWGGDQHIIGDEDLTTFALSLPMLLRLAADPAWLVVFCSPKRRDDVGEMLRGHGLRVGGEVVWDKKAPGLGGGLRYRHETVLLCPVGKAMGKTELHSVIAEWVPKGQHGHRQQYHTHEKPLGLLRQLVRYTGGRKILDPFCGSGSALVAAMQVGCSSVGVERDPAYFATALARLRACHGVGSLFDPGRTGVDG